MATQTFNAYLDNSTDTNFRAWGSALSAALAALGLVQTGDTGQINWTTVAHPTAVTTASGYEIWRFNDTLQSTAPVFLKIEYGSGSTSANNPSIWITVGTGSNGAGTLTGTTSSRRQCNPTGSDTATQYPCYISSDGTYLTVMMWQGRANAAATYCVGALIAIERSRNADGTANGEGLLVFNCVGTNASTQSILSPTTQSLSFTRSAVSTAQAGVPVSAVDAWASMQDGGVAYFAPVLISLPKISVATCMAMALTADCPARTIVPSTGPYGTARTYIGTGITGVGYTPGATLNQTQQSLVLRYD